MSVWMKDNWRLPYHGRLARANRAELEEPEYFKVPSFEHGRDARDTVIVAGSPSTPMCAQPFWLAMLCIFGLFIAGLASAADLQIGVAKTDITPSTPIRLTGYAAR